METVHLIGAEDVVRAGNTISAAASEISRAMGFFEESVRRFEEAVNRLERLGGEEGVTHVHTSMLHR